MFDSKYFCVFIHLILHHVRFKILTIGRQPMVRQLHKLRREGIHGGPKFLTWFREYVNPDLTSDLSLTYIMFNHLTYLIGSQCVLAGIEHEDLCQLSYGSIVAKSYCRYDVNRFCFRSTVFEASRPLVATTNT
jgi:hypothetical protein